jgi:putative methionine-R-sulfoxide reductase with GAF domain
MVAPHPEVDRHVYRTVIGSRKRHPQPVTGEVSYLREQLRLAARLTSRLASKSEIEELAQLVVDELHETFAFYLAAIQRLDEDGVLRLVAGRGPLAEVMTEFLLTEQHVSEGVNGKVARSGHAVLVRDTRKDRDYIVRDPKTDPRSELAVPVLVDGSVWGVLNIEATEPGALAESDTVLVEAIATSFGAAVHRARLVADLEGALTTALAALTSTVEAKDDYTACHGENVAVLAEQVALRLSLSSAEARDAFAHLAPPCVPATSAGTEAAIRTACPASRFRSPRASSPRATPTTRSSPTVPTAPRAHRSRRARSCVESPEPSSTPSSSMRSSTSSPSTDPLLIPMRLLTPIRSGCSPRRPRAGRRRAQGAATP